MTTFKVLTLIAGASLAYDGWALATGRTRFDWADTVVLILFVLLALYTGRPSANKPTAVS